MLRRPKHSKIEVVAPKEEEAFLITGLIKLLCVVGRFDKCGLHEGNIKFNTQNEYYISILIIVRVILPLYFYIHHVQKKILTII